MILKKGFFYIAIFLFINSFSKEIIVYSEDKSFFKIEVEGAKKKIGNLFRISNVRLAPLKVSCFIKGFNISKIIYADNIYDILIYAISKEGDGNYKIRLRGKDYDAFKFLKLNEIKIKDIIIGNKNNYISKFFKKGREDKKKNHTKHYRRKSSKIISTEYYNTVVNKLEYLNADADKVNVIKKSFNKEKRIKFKSSIRFINFNR